MRHILKVFPEIGKYVPTTDFETKIVTHRIPNLTIKDLPKVKLDGILFDKIELCSGVAIEAEALSWVLSKLRDVKDTPSGTGT